MPLPSNLRVSVQYKQSTVFAGEEIEATITFTNIAPPTPGPNDRFREPNWDASSRGPASYAGGERGRKPPPLAQSVAGGRHYLSRQSSVSDRRKPGPGDALPQHMRGRGGHRHTLSLNTAAPLQALGASNGASNRRQELGTAHAGTENGADTPTTAQPPSASGRPKHSRTLSILSLANDSVEQYPPQRRAHSRAVSVQVPRRTPSGTAGSVASPGTTSAYTSPKPSYTFPGTNGNGVNEYPFPTAARRSPLSPRRPSPRIASSRGSASVSPRPPPAFVFPPPSDTATIKRSPASSPDEQPEPDSAVSPFSQKPRLRSRSPRPLNGLGHLGSESSVSGTPRSSMDFYSQTNNSNETLASEYAQQPAANRWFSRPNGLLRRASSQRGAQIVKSAPESLMMGYAQIMGSFSVDGSLINQAPFEEVKRKGIIGTHGAGGVVGVEQSKRQSGLFGALSWGTIGESLTGILGGGELSSIKEMRGMAKDKNVPLLSTPQSILFVDLKLVPGESKAYTYSFKLPRGLPPSHKGRAIKLSYWITIGVQRTGSLTEGGQQVKSVDVPFRVLGSVNGQGEILGHDLMSPYVILRDIAKTGVKGAAVGNGRSKDRTASGTLNTRVEQEERVEFEDYIARLLSQSSDDAPQQAPALLSPTAEVSSGPQRRRSSQAEEPASMKEVIDIAILRSGLIPAGSKTKSNTRFDIARSGHRVAVVTLSRPAFRLGDTLNMKLDFIGSIIPTYAVHVSLDTTEVVDASLALRSASSISRVTKKVHASWSENTLFAKEIGVSLGVPWNAVPEVLTTGVRVTWKVRIEFIGPKLEVQKQPVGQVETKAVDDETQTRTEAQPGASADKPPQAAQEIRLDFPQLLEASLVDQRGTTLKSVDKLSCDSFEVEIPIRVYGAVIETGESPEGQGLPL